MFNPCLSMFDKVCSVYHSFKGQLLLAVNSLDQLCISCCCVEGGGLA